MNSSTSPDNKSFTPDKYLIKKNFKQSLNSHLTTCHSAASLTNKNTLETIKLPLLSITPAIPEHRRSFHEKHVKTIRKSSKKPALLPLLNESLSIFSRNNQEKVLNMEKFIVKKAKKPIIITQNEEKNGKISNYSQKINEIPLVKEEKTQSPPKKTKFSLKCPFSNPELLKNLKNENLAQKKESLEKNPSEKLSDFFLKQKFAYIILDFEQKVLKVPQLAKFFENIDTNKIFQNKLKFYKENSYGINNFTNNQVQLQSKHGKMGISDDDYNVFKGFFSIVMREHEVEEEIIAEFLNYLENYRRNIVCNPIFFHRFLSEIPNFEEILVEKFLKKCQNNHLVNQYFLKKDFDFQQKHCKMVILYLLKENPENQAEKLRENHKNCLVNDHVFYHFKQCFLQSLREFKGISKISQEIQPNPEETFNFLHQNTMETPLFSNKILFELGDKLETARLSILKQDTYYIFLKKTSNYSDFIDVFLEKTLNKPLSHKLFKKFPLEKKRRHAELMIEFLLGGPSKYSNCDITPAHYNLRISVSHFEEIRKALYETLQQFKFSENDSIYILSELDYFKYDLCNEKSLLERMGGVKTVDFIVNSFYLKAFQHPKFSHHFDNTEIVSMIENQKIWFCKFLDNCGMRAYHFKDLRTFHLGMGISEEAFEFFVKALIEGFKELQFNDEGLIKEIAQWFYRVKNDVLDIRNE